MRCEYLLSDLCRALRAYAYVSVLPRQRPFRRAGHTSRRDLPCATARRLSWCRSEGVFWGLLCWVFACRQPRLRNLLICCPRVAGPGPARMSSAALLREIARTSGWVLRSLDAHLRARVQDALPPLYLCSRCRRTGAPRGLLSCRTCACCRAQSWHLDLGVCRARGRRVRRSAYARVVGSNVPCALPVNSAGATARPIILHRSCLRSRSWCVGVLRGLLRQACACCCTRSRDRQFPALPREQSSASLNSVRLAAAYLVCCDLGWRPICMRCYCAPTNALLVWRTWVQHVRCPIRAPVPGGKVGGKSLERLRAQDIWTHSKNGPRCERDRPRSALPASCSTHGD